MNVVLKETEFNLRFVTFIIIADACVDVIIQALDCIFYLHLWPYELHNTFGHLHTLMCTAAPADLCCQLGELLAGEHVPLWQSQESHSHGWNTRMPSS